MGEIVREKRKIVENKIIEKLEEIKGIICEYQQDTGYVDANVATFYIKLNGDYMSFSAYDDRKIKVDPDSKDDGYHILDVAQSHGMRVSGCSFKVLGD